MVARLDSSHIAVLIDSLLIVKEQIQKEGRATPTIEESSRRICGLMTPSVDGLYVSTGDPKVLTDGIRRALIDLVGTLNPENEDRITIGDSPVSAALVLRRALIEFEANQ